MDLFVSDNNLTSRRLVEDYESIIWTERYDSPGDFSLVIKDSSLIDQSLAIDQYLLLSESDRIMVIESIEIENTSRSNGSKANLLTVTGRSIETALRHRHCETWAGENLYLSNLTYGGAINFIVNRYVVDPATAGPQRIPNLSIGSFPVEGETEDFEMKRSNILKMVTDLSTAAGYGFKIVDAGLNQMMFSVFKMSIPSGNQYIKTYSEDSDTLNDASYFTSKENMVNHAHVMGARTFQDVYAPGTPSNVQGLARRTLVVHAPDIGKNRTDPVTADHRSLRLIGAAELMKPANRQTRIVEGVIPDSAWADADLFLGQVIQLKDRFGSNVLMRIQEIVISRDSNGKRKIPSFETIAI